MRRSLRLIAAAAAVSILSGPLRAQDAGYDLTRDFNALRGTVRAQSKARTQSDDLSKGEKLVRSALAGMNDQGSDVAVGPRVAEFLRSSGIRIVFRDQPGNPVVIGYTLVEDGAETTIFLDRSLATASPRYLSIFLADAASRLMDSGFPDSAEKEYMRLSRMARVWYEMGGDRSKLPDFDGVRDEKTAQALETWFIGGGIDYVAGVVKKPTLFQLQHDNPQDQELQTHIAFAKHQFYAFAREELPWFIDNMYHPD